MLDATLRALSDSTRRSILSRIASEEKTVGEIAEPYDMSLAAISRYLKVLSEANLIVKRKEGRQFKCRMNFEPLTEVEDLIGEYRKFWSNRLDELDEYIQQSTEEDNDGK